MWIIETFRDFWYGDWEDKCLIATMTFAIGLGILVILAIPVMIINDAALPVHSAVGRLGDNKFIPNHYITEHHGKTSETIFIPDEEQVVVYFDKYARYWYFSPDAYHNVINNPPASIEVNYTVGRLDDDINSMNVEIK